MSLSLGIRRHPKHRAGSKVASLHDENQRLLTQLVGAGNYIAQMENVLTDTRRKRAEAEQVVVCLDADLDDLTAERDHLKAELAAVRRRLAPYLAAEANRNAITVPPSVRDTTAFEDQATEPIKVATLWAAHGRTDPAHLPTI